MYFLKIFFLLKHTWKACQLVKIETIQFLNYGAGNDEDTTPTDDIDACCKIHDALQQASTSSIGGNLSTPIDDIDVDIIT